MKFGRRQSLPRYREDQMTPDELLSFNNQGGVFRSRPGAPMAPRDSGEDPMTGLQRDSISGQYTETSWRDFFGVKPQVNKTTGRAATSWGLHGKEDKWGSPAMPVRPVPDVKNPMQVNPNAVIGKNDPSATFFDRFGRETTEPQSGQTQSGMSIAGKYGTATVKNAGDPLAPYALDTTTPGSDIPAFDAPPDLTTPEGLMAHANQTSLSYLQGKTTASGTGVANQYGQGFSHNAGDSSTLPDWTDMLPTI